MHHSSSYKHVASSGYGRVSGGSSSHRQPENYSSAAASGSEVAKGRVYGTKPSFNEAASAPLLDEGSGSTNYAGRAQATSQAASAAGGSQSALASSSKKALSAFRSGPVRATAMNSQGEAGAERMKSEEKKVGGGGLKTSSSGTTLHKSESTKPSTAGDKGGLKRPSSAPQRPASPGIAKLKSEPLIPGGSIGIGKGKVVTTAANDGKFKARMRSASPGQVN